jgi:hypothetical protein
MVEFNRHGYHSHDPISLYEFALKPRFLFRTHQVFGSIAKTNAEGTGKLMGAQAFLVVICFSDIN